MGAQHYPQYIDAALTAGTAVGNAVDDWATSGQDQPTVSWPIAGQEALFDGHDYHQPHAELGWIPESVMSEDELHSMMIDRSTVLGADAEDGQLADWGWPS